MIWEVVASEGTYARGVLNSITIKADIVLIHGDSLIIHSHERPRRIGNSLVSWNTVAYCNTCKGVVIVVHPKPRLFTPAKVSPLAARVTHVVVSALTALRMSIRLRSLNLSVHISERSSILSTDNLTRFARNFFASDCLYIRTSPISAATSVILVNIAAGKLVRTCSVKNLASWAMDLVVV